MIYKTFIKNILTAVIVVPLFLFALASFSKVHAEEEQGFTISNYQSNILINKDGSLEVTEKISTKFLLSRHGIYRYIPLVAEVKTDNGLVNRAIDIDVLSVTRNGKSEKFEKYIDHSTNLNLENKLFGFFYDQLVIKIGEKDRFVTSNQEYEIKYKVKNVLIGDEPILYWGVIGTGWKVNIEKSSVSIQLSDSTKLLNSKCFAGAAGSSEQKCQGVNGNFTTGKLLTGEGFNVEVQIPKSYFTSNTNESEAYNYLKLFEYNWLVLGFLLAPIFALILITIYRIRNRASKGTGVIVPQYNPPDNISPSEAGLIYDESVDNVDHSATFIDLAIRGYIKIESVNDGADFALHKGSSDPSTLKDYELKIYNGFFKDGDKVSLSSLQKSYYITLGSVNGMLKNWALKNKLFRKNAFIGASITESFKDRAFSTFIFLGIAFGGLWYLASSFLYISIEQTLVYVALSIIVCLIAYIAFITINHRTKEGVLLREKILGLEQYIELGEKNRINMLNTPEMSPQLFEKLLPYAMIFRQHKAWAEKFKDIYITQPDWYVGDWTTFNTIYFISSLDNMSRSFNSLSNMPSVSTSSGFSSGGFGGSVGGGFGGGGGGSW